MNRYNTILERHCRGTHLWKIWRNKDNRNIHLSLPFNMSKISPRSFPSSHKHCEFTTATAKSKLSFTSISCSSQTALNTIKSLKLNSFISSGLVKVNCRSLCLWSLGFLYSSARKARRLHMLLLLIPNQ